MYVTRVRVTITWNVTSSRRDIAAALWAYAPLYRYNLQVIVKVGGGNNDIDSYTTGSCFISLLDLAFYYLLYLD